WMLCCLSRRFWQCLRQLGVGEQGSRAREPDSASSNAYDFEFGLAFCGASGNVVFGALIDAHAADDGQVQGAVGGSIAAAVKPVVDVLPLLAGCGATPQSIAKAASLVRG